MFWSGLDFLCSGAPQPFTSRPDQGFACSAPLHAGPTGSVRPAPPACNFRRFDADGSYTIMKERPAGSPASKVGAAIKDLPPPSRRRLLRAELIVIRFARKSGATVAVSRAQR